MSKVNVPLLRETLEWALNEHRKQEAGLPSEWDQGNWLSSVHDATVKRLANYTYYASSVRGSYDEALAKATEQVEALNLPMACGTACCIAGRIVLVNGWESREGNDIEVFKGDEVWPVDTLAAELLGLSPSLPLYEYDDDGDFELFEGDNTIRDLYRIAGELTDGEIEMPAELVEAL